LGYADETVFVDGFAISPGEPAFDHAHDWAVTIRLAVVFLQHIDENDTFPLACAEIDERPSIESSPNQSNCKGEVWGVLADDVPAASAARGM
jgi:hypothetical protein